jgi:hypothetical protein
VLQEQERELLRVRVLLQVQEQELLQQELQELQREPQELRRPLQLIRYKVFR